MLAWGRPLLAELLESVSRNTGAVAMFDYIGASNETCVDDADFVFSVMWLSPLNDNLPWLLDNEPCALF